MSLLVSKVVARFLKIRQPCGLMMFIPAPETTTRVTSAKPWGGFEHTPAGVLFHHNLRGLNWVSFRDVHLEMNMIPGEPEIPKHVPVAFHSMERLGARIYVLLFLEAVIVAFCFEHHGHPVIAGVTRNLFRASATYNFIQSFCLLSRLYRAGSICLPHATRICNSVWWKKENGLSSAGPTLQLRSTQYSRP